jgi:hypothetical protein
MRRSGRESKEGTDASVENHRQINREDMRELPLMASLQSIDISSAAATQDTASRVARDAEFWCAAHVKPELSSAHCCKQRRAAGMAVDRNG